MRSAADAVPPLRIDTHAHVFARDLSMADGRRYTPGYDVTVEDYVARLDASGMTHGVLVQPSFLGTDNRYMLAALAKFPDRLRAIAMVDADISHDELLALDAAGVVGIRFNLVGGADIPDLQGVWRPTLNRIARLGWQVEVHREARDLKRVLEPLLALDLNVVVDHFGRPDAQLGADDPGLHYLMSTAQSRKVWVKLSAAYRNSPHEGGMAFARETYRLLRESFGTSRLLWGSDWPHTQHEHLADYDATWKQFCALVPSEEEREEIAGRNAGTLFKFC